MTLARLAEPLLERMYARVMHFPAAETRISHPSPAPGRRYLLYVHVPFCRHLCPFCAFHRVRYDPAAARRYFRALRAEISCYHSLGFDFADVYVGGGTPTVDLPELERTLELIRSLFAIDRVSVESNPSDLGDADIARLARMGVNRLSVGVQSLHDDRLRAMGRLEPYGSAASIADRLRAAEGAFDTVNADMMFNLPGQTPAELESDIDRLVATGVGQVSYYPLMVARATRHRMRREMGLPRASGERRLYELIVGRLGAAYTMSSVWCFSRGQGLIDEYVVDHDEFVGVGSGAFSYLGGTMYATSFSILRYDKQIESARLGITRCRPLTRRERCRFHLLTRLFALSMSITEANAQLGDDFARVLAPELAALRVVGAVQAERDELRLTPRGRYYWLVLMRGFLNAANNFRDEMRRHIGDEYRASYGELIDVVEVP